MFPGYLGEFCVPYFSPIFIEKIEGMKTGKNIIKLNFLNALYAQGVQNFEFNLQILKRSENYLFANIQYNSNSNLDRFVVISTIEFEWIKLFCKSLWESHKPDSIKNNIDVDEYLNKVFLRTCHY